MAVVWFPTEEDVAVFPKLGFDFPFLDGSVSLTEHDNIDLVVSIAALQEFIDLVSRLRRLGNDVIIKRIDTLLKL